MIYSEIKCQGKKYTLGKWINSSLYAVTHIHMCRVQNKQTKIKHNYKKIDKIPHG